MRRDIMIIAHLRKNSRETLTEMSRQIKIPISTIYDRMKLHENDLIIKYTSILNFDKLGFKTRAHIAIKVDRNQREAIEKFLILHTNVNSVYKINNGFDYMMDVVFKHVKDMEDFIEQMENRYKILQRQTYYVIEDIKREEFLTNPKEAMEMREENSSSLK